MQIWEILLFHVGEALETGAAFATRRESQVRCFVQLMLYSAGCPVGKNYRIFRPNDGRSGFPVAFGYYVGGIARAKTVRPEANGLSKMNVDNIPTSRGVCRTATRRAGRTGRRAECRLNPALMLGGGPVSVRRWLPALPDDL